jgi:hypothetical protein
MEIRQAERKQAKIKMGLQGPSGSGKTYSALLLAYGLTQDWTKIVVIDSEQHSSDLYAHLGNYNVLHLEQPFSPERYFEAIELCEDAKMEVIIIDSISHEWDGSGGILDIHGNMTGNSFTNWSKVTPRHNAFVQKILQCNCHVVATIRSKQDYILTEKNGKQVPEKVGLKGVTRDGMDYELTLVFELDLKHNAIATKDRTGLFMDKPHFIISTETGTKIKDWCSQGISLDDVLAEIRSCESVEKLRQIWMDHPAYRKVLEPDMVKRKEEILDERTAFIDELNL